MGKNGSILALMDKFLEDARAEKKAELGKDATGRGQTTHPVMDADNGTKPANEGERAKENDADISKALGDEGTHGQRDANSASSTKPTDSIGTMKMDASEVKGNVQTPKATKEGPAEKGRGDASPGHPSNATFSEKYSNAMTLGNRILASLATAASPEKKAEEAASISENAQEKKPVDPKTAVAAAKAGDKQTPPEDVKPAEKTASADPEMEKKAAAEKHKEDAEAGYLAAQLLATELGFVKGAGADAAVDAQVESIVKTAHEDAENLVAFINSHVEGMNMAAAEKARLAKQADDEAGPGGPAPEGPVEEEAEAAAAGAGAPPGMEGGGGGGADEAAIAQIAQLLSQAGVTPEELEAVLAQQGGGAEGGMPGGEMQGGGGIPAEALAAAAGGGGGGVPVGA